MLKKDVFNYGDKKVDIYELSGLQRIDYLTLVKEETEAFDALPDDTPVMESNIAFSSMRLRINAWLVAASLWHEDKTKDVVTEQGVILEDWSSLAISECSQKVLALSDMLPPEPEESADATEGYDADLSPAKS
ncbi:phage minor tail protein G [Serratia rubidaea]|uniref:Phage minor tail protein G n=1 Tax=Serratia rubidaea TaxID=61652 RepID=A0A3S4FNU3_SERRU|nr:phage minor tail protein G [Serratia rubidaea]